MSRKQAIAWIGILALVTVVSPTLWAGHEQFPLWKDANYDMTVDEVMASSVGQEVTNGVEFRPDGSSFIRIKDQNIGSSTFEARLVFSKDRRLKAFIMADRDISLDGSISGLSDLMTWIEPRYGKAVDESAEPGRLSVTWHDGRKKIVAEVLTIDRNFHFVSATMNARY